MDVKNIAWNENQRKRSNHSLLPKAIRSLTIGKSGCGKNYITNKPFTSSWLA